MLIWRPRSRSISRVAVINDDCNEAGEMFRFRGRQMSMTILLQNDGYCRGVRLLALAAEAARGNQLWR